jgi:hypothetical protein
MSKLTWGIFTIFGNEHSSPTDWGGGVRFGGCVRPNGMYKPCKSHCMSITWLKLRGGVSVFAQKGNGCAGLPRAFGANPTHEHSHPYVWASLCTDLVPILWSSQCVAQPMWVLCGEKCHFAALVPTCLFWAEQIQHCTTQLDHLGNTPTNWRCIGASWQRVP